MSSKIEVYYILTMLAELFLAQWFEETFLSFRFFLSC